MAHFEINGYMISLEENTLEKRYKYVMSVDDGTGSFDVKCTLAQLETLGKGILAYVAKEKV